MKFLKVLIVPAMLLLSVVMATPALAHEATLMGIQAECRNGQICIDVDITIPKSGNEARTIKFGLFGVNGQTLTNLGEVTVDLPASNGKVQDVNVTRCFRKVTGTFDHFLVKYEGASGDLTLNDSTGNEIKTGDKVLDRIASCAAPTPTPPPTPTATPTATPAAAALASTGGFDFRFPLVGLTVLVGGVALLLVSVSRGRSPSK